MEKDQHHETKRQQERELDNQISSYRQEVAAGEQSIYRQLTEMDELAEAFAFDEHAFTRDEITKTLTVAYDFTYINNTLSAHTQTITQAIKAMEKEKQMAESYEKLLLELEMLKKEQQQKERLLEQANRQLMEIQEESVEKLHLNNQKNREYIIPAEGLSQLAREIRQFGPDDNANNITRILQQQYHHQQHQQELQHALSMAITRPSNGPQTALKRPAGRPAPRTPSRPAATGRWRWSGVVPATIPGGRSAASWGANRR